jgi:hypothetical protein
LDSGKREGFPFSSFTDFAPSNQPCFCNEAFLFRRYQLLGRENGGFHAWKITYHHCRHYYYGGAHAALTPYKLRASSSSGPRKTEDQAAKRLHKTFSWCLACTPHAWLPLRIPSHYQYTKPLRRSLVLNEQRPRALGSRPSKAFGPKHFLTLSPGKCTRNGNFPTGCRHSHLTYIDWPSFSSITPTG